MSDGYGRRLTLIDSLNGPGNVRVRMDIRNARARYFKRLCAGHLLKRLKFQAGWSGICGQEIA
jgi:hypothetical protein